MRYHGKHAKKTQTASIKKSALLLMALALILTISASATLAYIIDSSGPVKNIFNPSEVTCEVYETFDGSTKSNVKIANTTEDTDVYIRAAVVVTWKDTSGNVYGKLPVAGTDYTITFSTDANDGKEGMWVAGADGYYYWTKSVAAKTASTTDMTGVLITSCTPVAGKAPSSEYYLSVEILAQAIQSKPADAVANWSNDKVTVSGDVDGTTLTVTNVTTSA